MNKLLSVLGVAPSYRGEEQRAYYDQGAAVASMTAGYCRVACRCRSGTAALILAASMDTGGICSRASLDHPVEMGAKRVAAFIPPINGMGFLPMI